MNRTIRIFLCWAVLMLLTVSTVFAGHLEDIAVRGTIRIGTTGDYIPMSYLWNTCNSDVAVDIREKIKQSG